MRGLYDELLAAYGPQGWWPIVGRAGQAGFDARGYHPGVFDQPRTPRDRFEIVIGAILTQNTAWTNVEKSLAALRSAGIRTPSDVLSLPPARLGSLIRSSGYYNQKAKKLRGVAALFDARGALGPRGAPDRAALLAAWGVGPETADSILLYAFQAPVFVVDAYTRRFLARVGLVTGRESYDGLQALFHAALGADHVLFNEYHGLVVAHAKEHCRSTPSCAGCPVSGCASRRS